jgi:DNA polymerase-3 subunit delta
MRLKSEQLAGHLQQHLLPVYLVSGDEALLVEETSDLIRQQARKLGANDRQVWHVEGRFDWSQLQWQEQTMSLFASQRLIEIRLPSGSPGKEGGEALRKYAENPPADTTLLIISGKIDSRSQKSKWFTLLESIGVTVSIWPVDFAHLPRWIQQRMSQRGLTVTPDTAGLIAERVEGNLFAAAQEIDKLQLLSTDGMVNEQLVLESVADNARFEAFGLMDKVFLGQAGKVPRIIGRLRAEGVDILSLFSAVSWSIHRAINMATQLEQGQQLSQVFSSQKPPVWQQSQAMMRQALMRHDGETWRSFLHQMTRIDQTAKGNRVADPWLMLERLCLHVAGAGEVVSYLD